MYEIFFLNSLLFLIRVKELSTFYSKQIQVKEAIAKGFIDAFQLKAEEVMIIRGSGTSNTEDIDERFFEVLNKVKKIHENSKILLTNNQHITGSDIKFYSFILKLKIN
jgi:hypothetical protein